MVRQGVVDGILIPMKGGQVEDIIQIVCQLAQDGVIRNRALKEPDLRRLEARSPVPPTGGCRR